MLRNGLPHRIAIGGATALLAACSSGADVVSTSASDTASTIAGVGIRSNEDLATSWWSWAASEPDATNPVVDDTGDDCARNQPNDVWFLAGNSGGESQRSCSVPADRELFFPVLNAICSPGDGCVDWFDDAEMEAVLDGELLELVEIDTDIVQIDGVAGNSVTFESGPFSVIVAGWWVRLDALPEGSHLLEIYGRSVDGFEVAVTYDLNVEGSSATDAGS